MGHNDSEGNHMLILVKFCVIESLHRQILRHNVQARFLTQINMLSNLISLRSKRFCEDLCAFCFLIARNWDVRKKKILPFPHPTPFFRSRPNFSTVKQQNLTPTQKPYGNACHAGYNVISSWSRQYLFT